MDKNEKEILDNDSITAIIDENDIEGSDNSDDEYEYVDSDGEEDSFSALTLADRAKAAIEEKREEHEDISLSDDKELSTIEKKLIGTGSSAATTRLSKEIRKFRKLDLNGESDKFGIKVELASDRTLHIWNAYLYNFSDDCPLYTELPLYKKKFGIDRIKLECIFPEDYPFSPPFIRVLEPRFAFRTGRVTIGGSICFELLTPSGWKPSYDMEGVLVQIRQEIAEGEPHLDFKNNKKYTEYEAKAAFMRVAREKGWM